MEPLNARSCKAAAWAWYQRGSGSAATIATARSEPIASATHRSLTRGGSSPSRFKLEADILLSSASIEDTSDRLKSLSLLPDLSDSNSWGSDSVGGSAGTPAPSSMPRSNSCSLANTVDLAIVMSSSSYGSASWDCGSALFDSFELVSMSTKLEGAHQLDEGAIEKVCPPMIEVDVSAGAECGEDEAKEDTIYTGLKSVKLITPMSSRESCRLNDGDDDTKSALNDCKQSGRQAIYDMFCRYENLETPVASSCDNEHMKKSPAMSPLARTSSKQHRRRRLHSLSKAFRHHFVQLTRQSGKQLSAPIQGHGPPVDEVHLRQLASASLPTRISSHLQPQHHKAACRLESPGRADQTMADGGRFEAPRRRLRKQYSSSDVHHHHHHYYHHHHHHHLLRHHSNDSLGLLPVAPLVDKSHQVAAAGLRASKTSSLFISPGSEGAASLDSKRKWGDTNPHVAANFPLESYGFPMVSQER